MWDVTITPSLDPASPLASLIGLMHAPTISGWAMALIPFYQVYTTIHILAYSLSISVSKIFYFFVTKSHGFSKIFEINLITNE